MFEFGKNWKAFSQAALDSSALEKAEASLRDLFDADSFAGVSFLDIGSGSGMFSIAAARMGAMPVTGVDVDPLCVDVAANNAERFAPPGANPRFEVASVLDARAITALPCADIVYAWGSLHHTGDMACAIRNAAGRVAPGGLFALAIYNRHWSSPVWTLIKKAYNASPRILRRLMVLIFAGVIFTAKFAVTRRNPLRQQRGMNFLYNVIDWIGGYPYEYASTDDIVRMVESLGFRHIKTVNAEVPTGCNEFVFEKSGEGGAAAVAT